LKAPLAIFGEGAWPVAARHSNSSTGPSQWLLVWWYLRHFGFLVTRQVLEK